MMKKIIFTLAFFSLAACQAPLDQKTYDAAPTKRVEVKPVAGGTAPDFKSLPAGDVRKKAFISHIKPLIQKENKRILQARQRLLMVRYSSSPSPQDQKWLLETAKKYDIENFSSDNENHWKLLFKRLDIVPTDLALAQAAHESGWGTSRFARMGKNLFGHWCFTKGCGIVPKERNDDARHEVAKFSSFKESIRRYIHNLNTGDVYKKLRDLRSAQRENGQELSSKKLAEGLKYYSERRGEYVTDIKEMVDTLH